MVQVWVMDCVVRDGEGQSFKIEFNIVTVVFMKHSVLATAVKVVLTYYKLT